MADEFSRLEELLDKLNDIDLRYQIEYEIALLKFIIAFILEDIGINPPALIYSPSLSLRLLNSAEVILIL